MQIIDASVTIAKFDSEIAKFYANQARYRERGILLLDVTYPDVLIGFAVTKLVPAAIAFAVKFNFNNYDLQPLSVTFVNPFTSQPLPAGPPLFRKLPDGQLQNLTQQDPAGLPFICIPGTREYHKHPAHTGNSWLLHRNKGGEGSLGFLLKKYMSMAYYPLQRSSSP